MSFKNNPGCRCCGSTYSSFVFSHQGWPTKSLSVPNLLKPTITRTSNGSGGVEIDVTSTYPHFETLTTWGPSGTGPWFVELDEPITFEESHVSLQSSLQYCYCISQESYDDNSFMIYKIRADDSTVVDKKKFIIPSHVAPPVGGILFAPFKIVVANDDYIVFSYAADDGSGAGDIRVVYGHIDCPQENKIGDLTAHNCYTPFVLKFHPHEASAIRATPNSVRAVSLTFTTNAQIGMSTVYESPFPSWEAIEYRLTDPGKGILWRGKLQNGDNVMEGFGSLSLPRQIRKTHIPAAELTPNGRGFLAYMDTDDLVTVKTVVSDDEHVDPTMRTFSAPEQAGSPFHPLYPGSLINMFQVFEHILIDHNSQPNQGVPIRYIANSWWRHDPYPSSFKQRLCLDLEIEYEDINFVRSADVNPGVTPEIPTEAEYASLSGYYRIPRVYDRELIRARWINSPGASQNGKHSGIPGPTLYRVWQEDEWNIVRP